MEETPIEYHLSYTSQYKEDLAILTEFSVGFRPPVKLQ